MDYRALLLTLQLATCTTALLLLAGVPLAYWLATTRWRGKSLLEALFALPLVLPPTVLGFYLLMIMGRSSPVGAWYYDVFGSTLPFSFAGILIASVIGNLPFAVRPFTSAFMAVDRRLVEASWCLGVSRTTTFFRLILPLSWPGILTGLVITFAHTVGEFGVVLMVGGNIPGVTRTLSIAIYDDVQALQYAEAAQAAGWLVAGSFIAITITYVLQRRVLPL